MDIVNKALWKFLIEEGEVVLSRDYYGWLTDYRNKHKLNDILPLVDWDNTCDVQEEMVDQFAGTFVYSSYYVKYLTGTLVYKSGKEEEWALRVDEDVTFHGVINKVLKHMEDQQ